MSEYTPSPLDVSDVKLPDQLTPAVAHLAENVHEVWALERASDGWKFGQERNDASKEHPGLVPYEQLSERERDNDRATAVNTLKVLLRLGYQIVPPEIAADGTQEELDCLKKLEEKLRAKEAIPTRDLRRIWQDRVEHIWALFPGLFELLGQTLLQRGYPLWANEVVIEGAKITPESVRLRQLHALGLLRTGRTGRASSILQELIAEDEKNRTGETLGLLASSYKASWKAALDETEKGEALEKCYRTYRTAFEQTRDYYPGINAATMAVISGDPKAGREIAAQVEVICQRAVDEGDRSFWTLSTIAEAALVKGESERAAAAYKEAIEVAPDDIASVSATRRQALMLAKKLGIDDAPFRHALPLPPVAVFGGIPSWCEDGIFLPKIEDAGVLREQMRAQIRESGLKVAYATGIGVGDLDFLEAMLEEKGEIHFVLPAPLEDLSRFFAKFGAAGEAWGQRLERDLNQASSIAVVSRELGSANSEVFNYANRILAGAAVLRGKMLDTPTRLVQLAEAQKPIVNPFPNCHVFEQVHRMTVSNIDWGTMISTTTSGLKAEVKGILFADLKGYSKMPESEIPLYITEFLKESAKLCDDEPGIQFRNTWGDAFYLVFETVNQAARFAKKLRSLVKDTDWIERGFSQNFGIRIALHAGPLFSFNDPVLNKQTYSGQHTSRGARIEPITDEGQVFVSEPFACIAAEGSAPELEFEYLGRRRLAKKYGDEGLMMLL
ncbi:MAG: tetratricopeptide (TPR) repeat protein [Verrucomicrobiales bacterium]|jgi:tetratricopeptide (TPR) repeat protein